MGVGIKRATLLLTLLLLLLLALPLSARSKLSGYVEQGGMQLRNSGTFAIKRGSDYLTYPYVQQSYPQATVTVYLTGTLTVATLYSDSAGTSKSNPFQATPTGFYAFYIDDGTYDIRFSGGTITTPFTHTGVEAGSSSSAVTRLESVATAGSGTLADPYTGWESVLTSTGTAGTGTMSVATGAGVTLTGVSTAFLTECKTGQYILAGGSWGIITAIADDGSLTLDAWRGSTKSGVSFTIASRRTVEAGDYWFATAGITIAAPCVTVRGNTHSRILHTGTGVAVTFSNAAVAGTYFNDIEFSNFTIVGNSSTTYGISANKIADLVLTNVSVKNATTACFNIGSGGQNGVIDAHLTNVKCSTNDEAMTTIPADGILLNGCNGCFVESSYVAGVTDAGIQCNFCDAVEIGGATIVEGNGTGIYVGVNANTVFINSVYFESNSTANIDQLGTNVTIANARSEDGLLRITGPGATACLNTIIQGGRFEDINITTDAGCTALYGPIRYVGTFTDSSDTTTIHGRILNANASTTINPNRILDHTAYNVQRPGTTPTSFGCSGCGSGTPMALDAAASDARMKITITAASGASTSGTMTIGWASNFSTAPTVTLTLENGTGTWESTAVVHADTVSTTGFNIKWYNAAVNLNVGSTYKINVHIDDGS